LRKAIAIVELGEVARFEAAGVLRVNVTTYALNRAPQEPAAISISERMHHAGCGRLTATQRLLFDVPRPEIEFYDTRKDMWELENLAAVPQYQEEIAAHFSMLKAWMAATGDFPPERRRRAGYVDRITGVLFSLDVPPMFNE
jgi:hypothetical protein